MNLKGFLVISLGMTRDFHNYRLRTTIGCERPFRPKKRAMKPAQRSPNRPAHQDTTCPKPLIGQLLVTSRETGRWIIPKGCLLQLVIAPLWRNNLTIRSVPAETSGTSLLCG